MIRAVILDLDDTLYLERDFVRSGFTDTAAAVEETGVAPASEVFDFLWNGFLHGRRSDAFDRLLRNWPQLDRFLGVDDLVSRYRLHRPSIEPHEPGAVAGIRSKIEALGLISDGLPLTQSNKLEALGLADSFDVTVLTGAWGAGYYKPHHRGFTEVEDLMSLSGQSLAYVADNPAKDFIAPNERGWVSIRLRMPGQLHSSVEPDDDISAPQLEVGSLADLSQIA